MNRFITSKQHYKMYKKGRFWVFAGITVATFTLNPLISRADTETTTAATAATTTAGASSSSNSQVLRTTTTSTTGATTQSSATAINAATTNTSAHKKQAVSGTTTDSKAEQPVTAVGENENATSNLSTSDSASASSQAKTGSGDSLDQTSNSSVSVASSSQKVTTQNSDYQNDQGTGSESGIQSNVTDTVVADESLQTNRSSVASPSTSTMASIGDSDSKDSNETEKVVDSETSPIAVTATTNTITTTNDKVQLNRALLARAATPAIVQSGTLGTSQWTMNSDGVVTIGAGDWSNVDDVLALFYTLGSTVTGVVIDGKVNAGEDLSYLFFKSPNLATITGFQNIDTSKVTDFSYMFCGTSVADFSSISHWDVSDSENFDSMFASNSKVQSIDLSHWELSQTQSIKMRRMFAADTALISMDLSAWNMSMVTNINGMFAGNDLNTMALKSVDLHGWNLKNVTDMGTMFNFDNSLTSVNMSGWQTSSNLSSVDSMFRGTSSLASLDLSSIDLQGVIRKYMLLSQNKLYDPIPSSLSTLTLGTMSVLTDTGLPDIPTGTGYTGKWVNQADATQTYTSSELMALYNGVDNPADTITWVWETSPSYADFTSKNVTGLIAGPKTTWRVADSVATLKDVNGTDIYATADTVVKVISVNGDTAVTTVDTQTAGTYQVDLQYTDAYGKVWQQTSTVAVAVNQGKLVGKPLAIKMGAKPTYTINDLIDTDNSRNAAGDKLSADELATATVTGLDTSKAGAQTVTLAYTDDATGMVHTTTTTVTMVATKADLTMRNSTIIKGPKNSSWDYRQYVTSVTDFDGNPVSLDGLNIVVDQQPDLTQIGSQTVTLTYTDALGNVISVPTQVTVVASQAQVTTKAPLTIWPSEVAQLKVADLVTITAANGNPVDTSTNLTDVTMSSIDTSKGGAQTVTITYTDEAGNLVTAYAKVTVDQSDLKTKLTNPIAGPKAKWDYLAGLEWVKDENGKLLDNLATADIKVVTEPDLSVAMVGHDQTVTLSYTDELGKEHLVTAVVNTVASKAKITAVSDQIIIPDEAKKLTATDLVSELIDAAGNKATNFDDVTMSGFDAKAIGPQTVTLTYSDAYGNQTTDSTTVTVDSATLTLQNHTQVAGPKATWNYADNIKAITDSKGQSLTLSDAKITVVQRPDLSVAGTYKIVLEYTDDLGQAHTETADVEVTASKAAITAVSKQVILAEKATMVTASSLVSTLYDADGVQIYNFDDVTMSGFNAKAIGPQTVTLAYTDAYGNQTTVSTTVTVDFATLTLQNHTQVAGSKATWNYADNIKAVTDSKGQSLTLSNAKITVVQHPDLSVAGTYPIVIEYTDDLGQVHTKTANVEATASKASITAVSKQVILAENANMVTASSLVSALYDVDGFQIHNFDDVTMSGFDAQAIGPQTVTLTYTDAYGNQMTDSTTVIVDLATITGQATHPIAGPAATWDYRDSVTQVIDANGKTIDVDTADITATTPNLTLAKAGKPQTVMLTYTDSLGKVHTTDVIVTTTLSKAKITAVADQVIWPDQAKQLTATDLVDRLYDAEGHLITNYDNVEMSVLDSKLAGQQRLTLTYTDVAGNQSVAYANVTVDQAKLVTKPSTVIAGPTATWSYEAGISQLTNAAGQLITVQPGTIKVLNRPDLNVDSVGQQQLITLIYTDELGKSQSVTAMVTAEASQATLTAKKAVILQPDAAAKLTANDLVTSLTDASGQAVTDYQIVQMSKLDATRPGVQPVSLTYTDAAGNEVSTVVKVTVDQAKMESQNRTQIWGPSMTWDYRQQLATVTDSQGHQLNPDQAKITVITGPQLTAKMIDKPQTVTLMYTDDLQQTHTVSATLTLTASQAALVPRPAQIVWAKDAGQLTPANFLQTITGADGTQVSSLTNVKMSAVDASQPGAQTVTLTYTDDYGNEVTTTAQVTVDQAALTTQTARPVAGPTAHWDYQTNFKTVTNAAGEVINVGDANLKVLTGPDLSTAMVGRPQVVTFSYTDELGLTQTTTAEVTTVASRAHMTTSADQVIWPAVVGKLTVADLVTGLTDAWGQTSQNYQSVTMTTINAQQAGKQQVTLTYTDEVGNVKTATTTVTVDQAALTTQPQTVIAGPTAKWDYHQGIGTITDGMGQPIAVNNAAITVVAMPDLTVAHIGQPQTVQLVYTDSLGQQQTALVQVTTVATQAKISTRPVTVIAGPKTTWSLNDSVDWSTSLAADGTLLTAAQRQRVTVDGTLNLRRASNYPLTLSYMDRAGNLITVTTSINVLASQAQLQVRDSQLTVGNAWTAQDNFERATDAQGQALTLADIAVDGTVNTQRAGQYTLTYHYTDVAGNQLTKTAVVTVVLPEDDHINTTDPDNNDHGETTNPDNNDHAGIADPSETPKPSERPNDSDGHTVDWGVDDRITTKQQPAAATRAQTKVKTTAEPALPANNEHTSAAKAAATPVTRVTDTTADTLPQTGERDRSAQQGAVVLGLTGLLGLMGLGRRRHTHED
ncbi:BspA family leucine-rich repeat surface protein [Lactiplantibacillus plantarum]|uniref:bacterial Ig-like domain-containing protein n=1 Tax=Lactiplantibacillus plantarum TaxID=1590 RepID=UPI000FFDFA5B|nr:bacterial Ig-like domain-containing protein [Lactiplantibacillus plantarum]QAT29338.1 BspA family leucine-rich repeat surface protein [Lactiplantibacillus plantarum]QAT33927.1 BspA family leucine-rich repeat surface protein [Lactiplantibacillus plantarum]